MLDPVWYRETLRKHSDRRDPSWGRSALPDSMRPELRTIVERCLGDREPVYRTLNELVRDFGALF